MVRTTAFGPVARLPARHLLGGQAQPLLDAERPEHLGRTVTGCLHNAAGLALRHADLGRVTVTCEGNTVADHPRVWAKHQTISDPEHLAAAKQLRRGRLDVVRASAAAELEVETRDLASYDTALGVTTASQATGLTEKGLG